MTTKRYTAKQLRDMAKKLHYSGTDEFSDEASFMLNQAAEDCEDAERWRVFINAGWPVCFLGPVYENLEALNAAVDTARTQEKARD
jgi:hypothetical protein